MRETKLFHGKTPFGHKNGRMLAPADVESGLACGCTCPGCGATLMAKKGPQMAWHFAHHSAKASVSCVESAIHAAAKQVLLEANWLRVPVKYVEAEGVAPYSSRHTKSAQLGFERIIRFERTAEEVWEVGVRPDVVGYRGEKRMLIEMYFRHQVDEVKLAKLREKGLPALEIDLSDLDVNEGFDAVRHRVLRDTFYKQWLVFPGEDAARAALQEEVDVEIREMQEKAARERAVRDAAIEREVAKKRRYQEAEHRRLEQARQRYRDLPQEVKEDAMRRQLSLSGQWPEFLDVPCATSNAIDVHHRVWQAEVFYRFLYNKAHLRYRFDALAPATYVIERFGVTENGSEAATRAVLDYLNHLRKEGFLDAGAVNTIGRLEFVVWHGSATPPRRGKLPARPRADTLALIRRYFPDDEPEPDPPPEPKYEYLYRWRNEWPRRHVLLELATAHLRNAPYRETLLAALEDLAPLTHPAEPLALVLQLEEQSVPQEATLKWLVAIRVVDKVLRRIRTPEDGAQQTTARRVAPLQW
jgi:hypothetical protein